MPHRRRTINLTRAPLPTVRWCSEVWWATTHRHGPALHDHGDASSPTRQQPFWRNKPNGHFANEFKGRKPTIMIHLSNSHPSSPEDGLRRTDDSPPKL
jgi:hypothetical protein